jgi:CheY-like chemotaxis protein
MAQTPAQSPVHTQAPLICIIDDDSGIRRALRVLLEGAGYRLREAADGLAGYTLLRDAPEPVVALIDYELPALDGCDLLELITTDEQIRTRHIFIMVTGSPPQVVEEDCGETLNELDAPVMRKPFAIDALLNAVAAAATRLPTG